MNTNNKSAIPNKVKSQKETVHDPEDEEKPLKPPDTHQGKSGGGPVTSPFS